MAGSFVPPAPRVVRFWRLDCCHGSKRLALVLGTEGDGLSRGAVGAADVVVRIPMAAGVDSLNVAAASAVAFWATRPVAPDPVRDLGPWG
jgi:tRNA G18 (ribose-2'-O)-methylase SpoU